MAGQYSVRHIFRFITSLALSVYLAACSGADSGSKTSDSGTLDSTTVGTGGSVATGGSVGTGGNASTGGSAGTGGSTATGGSVGTGGSVSTGGNTSTGGSVGTGGTSGAGGSGGSEYGFSYRKPGEKDLDWLCTFHQSGQTGYVYTRLTQTGTSSVGIATVPVYTASLAQISISGAVTALANAKYDYGAGHHNDSLQFDYQGKTYTYYHSSFGFGWRQCQPMDCINSNVQGSATGGTEGCSPARPAPEICVMMKADGTHDALVDTFKKCPGDANK